MTNKTSKVLKIFSEYFQIVLGIILASIGLKAFLLPNVEALKTKSKYRKR